MTISTFDQYMAAAKQKITLVKTATRTTVAGNFFSLYDIAGNPAAGTFNVGNSDNGLVPTDATAGAPAISDFGSGNTGYLTGVQFNSSVSCSMLLYDRLFHAGAYNYNANVTLTNQPSFAARCPDYTGGSAFGAGNMIFFECVTTMSTNLSIAVTYTNSNGVTGRTTGTVATGVVPVIGRMIPLPLQSGDFGVQKIESVVATGSTAGTFNIIVARPLWSGFIPVTGGGDNFGLDRTGMPVVYADSCLHVAVNTVSTSSGYPFMFAEIANG